MLVSGGVARFWLTYPGFKVTSVESETCLEKPSAVGDFMDSSFLFLPDRQAVGETRARDDSVPQLHKPPSDFPLFSPEPRSIEAKIDNRVKQKPRQSRFQIRKRLGAIHPGVVPL